MPGRNDPTDTTQSTLALASGVDADPNQVITGQLTDGANAAQATAVVDVTVASAGTDVAKAPKPKHPGALPHIVTGRAARLEDVIKREAKEAAALAQTRVGKCITRRLTLIGGGTALGWLVGGPIGGAIGSVLGFILGAGRK